MFGIYHAVVRARGTFVEKQIKKLAIAKSSYKVIYTHTHDIFICAYTYISILIHVYM